MKNPGFIIYVEKKTKVKFILRCARIKNQEQFNLCLCLYKIHSDNNFSLVLQDENYMSSPWGYFSK